MKVLHFIHDNKFFAYLQDLFAGLAGVDSRYVALAPGAAPTEFLEGLPLWRRVGPAYVGSDDARADLEWCDCLVVHFLEPWGARLMLRAPRRVATVWSGWGGDYLDLLPGTARSLLGPETRALVAESARARRDGLRARARRAYEAAWHRLVGRRLAAAAARRADFFSAPLEEDYAELKSALGPRFRADYVQLRYGSNEASRQNLPETPLGEDILLGNSATPTNNHAEALRTLARLDLGARRVVAPLSYGDAAYGDAVEALGRRLLGARFEPLRRFLPMPEYNARLARCGIVVMNHRRQQGLGNIAAAMMAGARVHLDEEGMMYRFFAARGARVFGVRALATQGLDGAGALDAAARDANRRIIGGLWSQAAAEENARRFVERVEGWRRRTA